MSRVSFLNPPRIAPAPRVPAQRVATLQPFRRPARWRWCLLLAVLLTASPGARGEDTVVLRSPSGRERQQVSGTVLDYTGQQLVLRRSSGQDERYDGRRVVDVRSEWTAPHAEAEKLLAEGKPAEALIQLREALKAEPRTWVRRRIIARTVSAYYETGQVEAAGNAFTLLVGSDPETPYFAVIPLAWLPSATSAAVESRAAQWLAAESPAVRLLGASWLLVSPRRSAATQALETLARDEDPRVAFLASAQLWRGATATVTDQQLEQWTQLVERMPDELRAGPYLLLAQGYARREQAQQAALYYLRLPILFPEQRTLAAEALLAAGRQLEQLGRPEEAEPLYRELLADYPNSPLADQAQRQLSGLKSPSPNTTSPRMP